MVINKTFIMTVFIYGNIYIYIYILLFKVNITCQVFFYKNHVLIF